MRFKLIITGLVQGVGFRPFIYRIAHECALTGWIKNTEAGVFTEVQGTKNNLDSFFRKLENNLPPQAEIYTLEKEEIPDAKSTTFKIIHSDSKQKPDAVILSDLALCNNCLREMNDPNDRRYLYPFITCTNCGPRYTIMTGLPYDRPLTTMHNFPLCKACRKEYEDPADRRFHAQPVACPECGPHISLWNKKGNIIAEHEKAIEESVLAVKDGKILAMKGLGGFHLICDAQNKGVIQELRQRKNRPTKPFALMCPSMIHIKNLCDVNEEEEKILTSAQAPIVLLQKKKEEHLGIAPGNPYLGIMLPYTPLHHLFLQNFNAPIVATSGNRANEPICTNETEALNDLQNIADLFLVHNRPIAHRTDDSIIRIIHDRPVILRRARGFAPLPFRFEKTNRPILSVGGHLKNTIALAIDDKIMTGPHVGDLDTLKACQGHEDSIQTLSKMYECEPTIIAQDLHPEYTSTQMAKANYKKQKHIKVQHHYAHALACMTDNRIGAPCLAIVWDGTGLGDDGTIWGGEFLGITKDNYKRLGHFYPFPLPGGDLAAKEPRRAALGLLYTLEGESAFTRLSSLFKEQEIILLKTALEKKINTPMTSSAGRLFDAVSALLNLKTENSFEGEAAMQLEFMADEQEQESYPFKDPTDWRPLLSALLNDKEKGIKANILSARFHNTLVKMLCNFAKKSGYKDILLTGGCFQNKLLTEKSIKALKENGLTPYWHKDIPPNDGGIAIGQAVAAIREENRKA